MNFGHADHFPFRPFLSITYAKTSLANGIWLACSRPKCSKTTGRFVHFYRIKNTRREARSSSCKGDIGTAPKTHRGNFHVANLNKLWLTDITGFRISAGKIYLNPMIDCFNGLCVSWAQSTSPNAELVNSMLDEVLATAKSTQGLVIHNDRGCHYRRPVWIERCDWFQATRLISNKGCSSDNVAMEGFFIRLKVEFSMEETGPIRRSRGSWMSSITISIGAMRRGSSYL